MLHLLTVHSKCEGKLCAVWQGLKDSVLKQNIVCVNLFCNCCTSAPFSRSFASARRRRSSASLSIFLWCCTLVSLFRNWSTRTFAFDSSLFFRLNSFATLTLSWTAERYCWEVAVALSVNVHKVIWLCDWHTTHKKLTQISRTCSLWDLVPIATSGVHARSRAVCFVPRRPCACSPVYSLACAGVVGGRPEFLTAPCFSDLTL